MQVCPSCGAAVDASRSPLGGAVSCQRCGALAGSPLPSKPPVVAQPQNPFSDQANPAYQYVAPPLWKPNRALAQSKVQVPGIILQVTGGFFMVAGIACLVALPFLATQANEEDRIISMVMFGFLAPCCLVSGGVVFWGGTKMKRLESYGWALAAVIVTGVAAVMICPVTIIVGIWPLVVLLDADVKGSFGTLPS